MGYVNYIWQDYQERRGPVGFPTDAWHQYQTEFLRNWLTKLEMIMEDNGVAAHVIRQIITTLIYGQPDPADTIIRQDYEARLMELIESGIPSVVVPSTLLPRS